MAKPMLQLLRSVTSYETTAYVVHRPMQVTLQSTLAPGITAIPWTEIPIELLPFEE